MFHRINWSAAKLLFLWIVYNNLHISIQVVFLILAEELKANDIDERLFKLVHFQLFPVIVTYSARQFAQLLNTFSNHLAAPKEVQHAFYEEIETLINNSFQGKIDKHFSMSLTVAEKI